MYCPNRPAVGIRVPWKFAAHVENQSTNVGRLAISREKPDVVIYTDSPTQGFSYTGKGLSGGGAWSPEKSSKHIIIVELTAAFFAYALSVVETSENIFAL